MDMKSMATGLALTLAGVVAAQAAIVENLLQDPGFEQLVAGEPAFGGTPWSDNISIAPDHILVRTGVARSGTNSVAFNHYTRTGFLSQKTGVQVEAGTSYELSVWMLLDEQSANPAHTNSTTINMAVATSPTENGTYDWTGVGRKLTAPSVVGQWQPFTFEIAADMLTNNVGEWIEIRFVKEYQPSEYRIFVDDASFGAVASNPPQQVSDLGIAVVDAQNVELSWTAGADDLYTVQRSENLMAGAWTNLVPGIEGIDGTIAVTTTATAVQSFYRIVSE